jgi:hypothetical protein
MDIIANIYILADKVLMPVFRIPDNPLVGYFLGTLVLSLICLIVGEYSMKLAFRLNKKDIAEDNKEMERYQDLSIKALKAGNKSAYKACNKIANDAFGKSFFTRITFSASSLWPVFIALGWMQYRFSEIEFNMPFSGSYSYGYVSTFIACYLAVRLLTNKIKRTFTLFKDQSV